MNSQSPLKRKGIFFVFVMLIVLNVFDLIETLKNLKYFDFNMILSIVSQLAFLAFCCICLAFNDKKNNLAAISLAAYAAISLLQTLITIFRVVFSEDFLFHIEDLSYSFNLIFFGILLIYAAKQIIPLPGAELFNSSMVQLIAVCCVWLLPIVCTFLLHGRNGMVAGSMILMLLSLILRGVAFSWFIKD